MTSIVWDVDHTYAADNGQTFPIGAFWSPLAFFNLIVSL